MKVAVLGSGAMGCLFGAAFHRAEADVVLVDVNADHVDAINAGGLKLDLRGGSETLSIRAAVPSEISERFDLVMVFTKTFHTQAALEGIVSAIGEDTHLLSLQNGLGNDRRLAGFVSEDRVMVGASMLPSDLVGPGHIRSHGEGYSKLYPAFGSDTAMAERVAALLSEGGLETVLDPQIHAAIWSKAIFNAAMNPLCALTLRTPGFLGAHDEALATIHAVVEEGVAAAQANGLMIDAQPIHDLTRTSMTDHADHEASMLQDIKAGRRTEIDAISGAIVEAAKAKGMDVPVTQTLWRLVKLEEAKLATAL
ncbi:ketopantoate reductase family protein [Aurantiacibacter poecillastricola]|uniref:ketopantoate reductase family protein n=1 Tax=Aurantiacibacter poecillastricola TaxID=3064385 RepID=UPI00273D521D|nr:2-dehydropantoate 2-reductase [Aurantiacibacter sp. 219JJ12-13]MDP5262449.1 2-dehydropantoate 2-reductase [Aurantiacibacter sp. 219JJ12-13]